MPNKLTKLLIGFLLLGIILYWISWFNLGGDKVERKERNLGKNQKIVSVPPVQRPIEEIKEMIVQETRGEEYDSTTAELEGVEADAVILRGQKYKLKTPIKIVKDEGSNRNADTSLSELKVGDMVQGFYIKGKLNEGFVFLKVFKF